MPGSGPPARYACVVDRDRRASAFSSAGGRFTDEVGLSVVGAPQKYVQIGGSPVAKTESGSRYVSVGSPALRPCQRLALRFYGVPTVRFTDTSVSAWTDDLVDRDYDFDGSPTHRSGDKLGHCSLERPVEYGITDPLVGFGSTT